MEGWCVGVTVAWSHHSCTMGGHTNTRRDTITHTNEQNMHVKGHSALFRRNVSICFLLFFCNMHTNTGRALTCPSFELFFMHMYPLSSQIDPDIYELGLTCILLLLSLLLLCISGEGNNIRPGRGSAKAGAITAAIIRLVWFMIYADHILPEITPLEELGCKKLF